MATFKASQVTNNQATPRVSGRNENETKVIIDYTNVSSTIATGDLLQLAEVPMNARVKKLVIRNESLGTTVPAKIGIAYGNGCGANALATAIDDDYFATAHPLQTAAKAGTDLTFSAGSLADAGKTVWELAGLTSDPGGSALILGTVGTVSSGGTGKIITEVEIY